MNATKQKTDVTKEVQFEMNENEYLPVTKCVCGMKFYPWKFVISIYEDSPTVCPHCGRKLFFRPTVQVFEVVE